MDTKKRQSLDILDSVAAGELVEHAERVVIMHIRLIVQTSLLCCIFPVSSCILKEHDCKYHVN